jgi:hypothetical protein
VTLSTRARLALLFARHSVTRLARRDINLTTSALELANAGAVSTLTLEFCHSCR